MYSSSFIIFLGFQALLFPQLEGKGVRKMVTQKNFQLETYESPSLNEEECGNGYTCTYDSKCNAYGCAPTGNASKIVCCSVGQQNQENTENNCCGEMLDSTNRYFKQDKIPYCPANGATGEGCVRQMQKKEEECGDGFTCIIDSRINAYGCASTSNTSDAVCCSAGMRDICSQPGEECGKWCVDCSLEDHCQLQPGQLPYCPGNGATGYGCVRNVNSMEEECGNGFTCVHDDRVVAYGCAPVDDLSNMVCCSEGQACEEPGQECGKWCVDCSSSIPCNLKPGQLPYCPAKGATGAGCVR